MKIEKEKIDNKDCNVQIVKLNEGFDIIIDGVFTDKLRSIGIYEKDFERVSIKSSIYNKELTLIEPRSFTVKLSRFKKAVELNENTMNLVKGFLFYFYDNKNAKKYPLINNVSYFEVEGMERFQLTKATIFLDGIPIFFVSKDGFPITLDWSFKTDEILKRRLHTSTRDLFTDMKSPYITKMMGIYRWIRENFWLLFFYSGFLIILAGISGFAIGGGM